jgi:hypothetical protein
VSEQQPIEELYDPETVERLDAWARRQADRLVDEPLPVRQRVAATALIGAIGLGIQEVLEPQKLELIIEEVDADGHDIAESVRLLWTGEPRSTVALVRPWLFPGARSR